jgi:2-polyprenyl-3-methyl-5-hydroxy-6-metoxy-1,4-benzoquinol methylase
LNPHSYIAFDRCPLCEAAVDPGRVVTRRGMHFDKERVLQCLHCGLFFLDPRLSEEGLARFYSEDTFSEHYRGAARPDEEGVRVRDRRGAERLGHVRDLLRPGGRVLEIGCSCGSFLKALEEAGFRACGIDGSTGYAEFAKSRGLEVFLGQFPEDLPELPAFDAVALFHVIEHVHSPRDILTATRKLLVDGGRLLIEYPDVERALQRRELKSSYFQKWHLRDFSEATLTALLEQTGFSAIHSVRGAAVPYDKNVLFVAEKSEPVPQPKLRTEAENDVIYRRLVEKLRRTDRRNAWKRVRRAPRELLRRARGRAVT